MEPFAVAVFAFALILLLRRPGVFSPAFVLEGAAPGKAPVAPGDEDDQLPETDRAPRRWLPWAVLSVALVRVALLVTLHA
jgi:hypothetical protein